MRLRRLTRPVSAHMRFFRNLANQLVFQFVTVNPFKAHILTHTFYLYFFVCSYGFALF